MHEQAWFEMRDVRRRSTDRAVWIVLRAHDDIADCGEFGHAGYHSEYFGAGTRLALLTHCLAASEGSGAGRYQRPKH